VKGWKYESYRHSLAAKGIKTRTSFVFIVPEDKPSEMDIRTAKDEERKILSLISSGAMKDEPESKKKGYRIILQIATEDDIEIWRLIGALGETLEKFGSSPKISDMDKVFLKWGIYGSLDKELSLFKRGMFK
jgi:hypothetical protein